MELTSISNNIKKIKNKINMKGIVLGDVTSLNQDLISIIHNLSIKIIEIEDRVKKIEGGEK